jgi:hypothetical protein
MSAKITGKGMRDKKLENWPAGERKRELHSLNIGGT